MITQYEQAITLFEHLWRGGEYAMFWVNPGKTSHWFRTGAIPRAIKADFSRNLYFGVNPCTEIPTKNARGEVASPAQIRAQLPYIAALNCLFAEFDADATHSKLDLLTAIRLLIPAPTVITDSGGGYHCYWLLDKPYVLADGDNREYARKLQQRWVRYVGGDKGAADLCRVLRVPGSRNWKLDYAPDFPEIRFVRWLNIEYSLHQLTGVLPAEARRESSKREGVRDDDVLAIARAMIQRARDGEKHYTLLKAARLVGGFVAGGALTRGDAYRELCALIDAKAGVESKSAAYKTIEDGLDMGELAPLYITKEKDDD